MEGLIPAERGVRARQSISWRFLFEALSGCVMVIGACLTGIKIGDTQMAALLITRHEFHGDWNYTLKPEKSGLFH